MVYKTYQRNHVILKGRANALKTFLTKTYKGMTHKWKNGVSSNSEDALTWSCFDIIRNLPVKKKVSVLDQMLEDSYQGKCNFSFTKKKYLNRQIEIHIGKEYTGTSTTESTEVDVSIELPDKLIFFEAKLYSSISLVNKAKGITHDQIARKMRIGLDVSCVQGKEFYFIFLDVAPETKLVQRKSKKDALSLTKNGFYDKWKSAWWFNYYKHGRNHSLKPLKESLDGIPLKMAIKDIANNMGWLTWSDLYKDILRGVI